MLVPREPRAAGVGNAEGGLESSTRNTTASATHVATDAEAIAGTKTGHEGPQVACCLRLVALHLLPHAAQLVLEEAPLRRREPREEGAPQQPSAARD